MPRFLRDHPLLSVLLVAGLLRLIAVLFSRGYMASDDHYETIMVAYNWLVYGFFSDDGQLLWRDQVIREITRFPLYTMGLHAVMRCYYLCGVDSLDTMMYGVRAAHALLSLISVWAVYRIVELVTKSAKWAVAAGLIIAAQGLMPFLSVRALIEVVGGHFLILAVYLIYRYRYFDKDTRLLFWAGVLTGLAWMIRFQIALAVLPVPLILWWDGRRLKPPLQYCAGIAVMILASGLAEYFFLGEPFVSTVNLLSGFFQKGEAMYHTSDFIYAGVLVGFFIPPFSLIAFGLCAVRGFWREHKLLIVMTLSFVLLHTVLTNRQERFMIPIIPVVTVMLMLALHQHYKAGGWFFRWKALYIPVIGLSLIVNLFLLGVFTANYGHKGLVEPLVRMERVNPRPRAVFVSPERGQIYPYYYAGAQPIRRLWIKKWPDLAAYEPDPARQDYFCLYAPHEADLSRYVDSLELHVGSVREEFHVGPSTVDWLLNKINPKYNPTHEVWVYRLVE